MSPVYFVNHVPGLDHGVTRRLLARHLQDWGYEVTEAPNGASALSALAGAAAPRIAIIDWEMPTLSGVHVCRILRGRPGPYVYVMLLTGFNDERKLIEGSSPEPTTLSRNPSVPQNSRRDCVQASASSNSKNDFCRFSISWNNEPCSTPSQARAVASRFWIP